MWRHHALCSNMDFALFQTFLTHFSDTLVIYHVHTVMCVIHNRLLPWLPCGLAALWKLKLFSTIFGFLALAVETGILEFLGNVGCMNGNYRKLHGCQVRGHSVHHLTGMFLHIYREGHQPFAHMKKQVRVLWSSPGSHCGYKMELGCESNVHPQCLGFSCAGFELFRF